MKNPSKTTKNILEKCSVFTARYMFRHTRAIIRLYLNIKRQKMKFVMSHPIAGRVSEVGIATRYGWKAWGSNPGGVEIFRTRPDRAWDPPSLLYNGYRVCLWVKGPGRGLGHPTPHPHLALSLKKE